MPTRIDVQTEDLRLFLACVEAGTLSAAARTLGLTQGVASRRIQRLESALGAPVLHRTTRALRPTAAGTRLLGAARTVVAELTSFEQASVASRAAPVGDVHVTAPVLLGQAMGSHLAREVVERYPSLRLRLLLSNVKVDLVRAGMDVAVRVGELPDRSLLAVRVTTASVGAYARRGDAAAHRAAPRHPSALTSRPWLAMPNDTTMQATGPDGRRWTGAIAPVFACDDRFVLREAAKAGLGLVLLPTFFGDAEPALERVLPRWHFGRVPIHALWLPESKDDPRIRAVVDLLTRWGKTQIS
ncbi:MAG: LysR family transcriptional regulator [Deltaproteobacteria bacterium]|nr:LysR family transcriptional regulator [Deltaproteobacteria bacterium]